MKPRIINIKTLKQKKYDILDVGEYYKNLFGEIESRTSFFFYGTSGSGKSVFTIQFANFFCDKFRAKGLYCSHEEAFKKTFQDRTNNFSINSEKLYAGANINFDTLMTKIQKNYYRLAIIDSVQYMHFTYEQFQQLSQTFQKRKFIPVLVSFGKEYKKPSCDVKIMHACDVKVFFDKGVATIDSRYLPTIKKVRLFTPQTTAIVQQPTLF